ncbi:MAG: hypothetical protein ACR2JS_02135 [Candidatus Nanopelagicales bacterium]
MTNSQVRRPSRRGHSTTDKVVSAGLAAAACAGLVGVIAVRTTQDAQAADAQAASSQATAEVTDATLAVATTSTGLTQEQLDQYAAQLEAERLKLIDYRDQLALAAASLNGAAQQTAVPSAKSGTSIKTPKVAAVKQKAKAKAKAQAKAKVTAPAQKQPQQQAQPQAQAPAPVAKPAPRPQAQVQQQAAPRPQAQTKSS